VVKSGLQVIDITMDAINEKPVNEDDFQLISAKNICFEAVKDFAYKDEEHAAKVSLKGDDFDFLVDPVLVKYVLYNLIGNALHYVKTLPQSEIVISLFPESRQIHIRDTGPGIESSFIPKLFESFSTSGKQGGTGLGLAYCKRTMLAFGGDIHCESELGEYSNFILSFPEVWPKKAKKVFALGSF
jgi:signal transduction histidine kinase